MNTKKDQPRGTTAWLVAEAERLVALARRQAQQARRILRGAKA